MLPSDAECLKAIFHAPRDYKIAEDRQEVLLLAILEELQRINHNLVDLEHAVRRID